MAGLTRKSLDAPDEIRPFEEGKGRVGAWTVGEEPCVVIDWQGFTDYAKR
jgi:hypothetical protein